MRQFKTFLFTAATMLLSTACSSDEPVVSPVGGDATVTFSVDVPSSIATRARTAYADGTTATRLTYAVYNKEGKLVTTKSDLDIIDLKASVTLNLISGETYKVAFWAAAKGAPYTFDTDSAYVKVDYNGATCNDESRDAFFACKEVEATANQTVPVTLTRPFAQLNIGTSDFDIASKDGGFVPAYSSVKVKAYDKFDILTGEAAPGASYEEREFALSQRPQGETFPVDSATYDYLAMNYLLMMNDQEVSDVEAVFSDKNGHKKEAKYLSIPLKRNYRTNIYGQLLTTTNTFNVQIVPDFNTPSYDNVYVWDGKTTDAVQPVNGVIEIKNAPQLARIFYKSNETYWDDDADDNVQSQTYANNTISLDVNVDLDNQQFTPIASHDGTVFEGTFDGQGHTIKNLVVDVAALEASYENTDEYYQCTAAGLFGNLDGATIKNLTIENVTIKNANNSTSFAGVLAGIADNATIENVKITGKIIVEGVGYVGGILGRAYSGTKLSNITIDVDKDSYLQCSYNNSAYVGGLIGHVFRSGTTVSNVSSNLNVIAKGADGTLSTCAGGLIGYSAVGLTLTNCSSSAQVSHFTNDTRDDNPNPFWMTVGGLIGSAYAINNSAVIINFNQCSFTGDIHSYNANGDDVTATVKANNSYWKYIGWFGGSGTPAGTYSTDKNIVITK